MDHAQARPSVVRMRDQPETVFVYRELTDLGCTRAEQEAHLAAGRWRRVGRAIITHTGGLTRTERWSVARANCGRDDGRRR